MHCNSTVTSTGNFVASRSYCIFTVVTFYSVGVFFSVGGGGDSHHIGQYLDGLVPVAEG